MNAVLERPQEIAKPATKPERRNGNLHFVRRRQIQNWTLVGAGTLVAFGIAFVVGRRLSGKRPARAKSTQGAIDWRLSQISNNRVVFRPTVVLTRGRAA